MLRVAIYARVSTQDQDCSRQIADLREWSARLGADVTLEHKETGSGADTTRQARKRILEAAKRGTINAVLVTEATRWSRSLSDLLSTLSTLAQYRVALKCLNGVEFDLSTSTGKLMATLIGAFAEFERDLIVERVKSGLDMARSRGVKLGRVKGYAPAQIRHREHVLALRAQGVSIRSVAAMLRISPRTVQTIVNQNPVNAGSG